MTLRWRSVAVWFVAVFFPFFVYAGSSNANDDFSSNLPLLVFGLPNNAGTLVSLRIINNSRGGQKDSDSINRPHDPEALLLLAEITPSNGTVPGEPTGKHSLTLRLTTADGKPQTASLLGMPEASVWTLSGSELDRGMLRTYLAHTLAEGIYRGHAPKVRYCEVFFQDGEVYQGVYLLSEYIENGVWQSPVFLNDGGYAAISGNTENVVEPNFSVLFGDPAYREAIRDELESLETKLGSDDGRVFFSYLSAIDEDSFIDAHILNSVLMNLHGDESFIWHKKSRTSRIKLSPLWKFDKCLDNSVQPESGEQESVWFERLLLSESFLEEYRHRYYSLWRGAFAPDELDRLVDSFGDYLGPALARDWSRWQNEYNSKQGEPLVTDSGDTLIRATTTPRQDLLKIKHRLRLRSYAIHHDLGERSLAKTLVRADRNTRRNFTVAGIFFFLFFVSVWYARNKM